MYGTPQALNVVQDLVTSYLYLEPVSDGVYFEFMASPLTATQNNIENELLVNWFIT